MIMNRPVETMTAQVAEKIRSANVEVHRREAQLYDAIHPEIFSPAQQRTIEGDLDFIAAALPRGSSVRALDIGCGTGNLTLKYLRRGYRVKAVDVSPEMIDVLRSKLSPHDRQRVELVVRPAEEIVSDPSTTGTWDLISMSAVLHHLPDYHAVLDQALQQLRPGGVLYVCHEPLRASAPARGRIRALVDGCVELVDSGYLAGRKLLVYLRQAIRTRAIVERIDYSWSDYHVKSGIDAEALARRLRAADATVLLFETYRSRYWSPLSSLDARWLKSDPCHFRLIVQR